MVRSHIHGNLFVVLGNGVVKVQKCDGVTEKVGEPSPKASTSQQAAIVIEGPAEPRARPARVTSGRVGS